MTLFLREIRTHLRIPDLVFSRVQDNPARRSARPKSQTKRKTSILATKYGKRDDHRNGATDGIGCFLAHRVRGGYS